MFTFCFIIPFITCLILFIWFRQVTVWWEYIVLVIPSIIFSVILYFSFKAYGTTDTEYLGYYVTKVSYYEPWNEYVHRTCTRKVYTGTDSNGNARYRTETYDCSYVDYHPAKWTMTNNKNYETYIRENVYNKIKSKFGTSLKFVDMHRHYYTLDGDKYECYFNGDRNRMWTLTESHYYKNKILKSRSIFNFSEVSDKTKKEYKLYDYSDFSYAVDQNPVLSEIKISKAVVDSFKYLNAYYGSKYQFRTYVMIWKNMPYETSLYQQNYWVGGNKNELCICMSVDNYCNIQWVNAFSWEDKPELAISINHLFHKGDTLDLMRLNRFLLHNVPRKWCRKAFADFDYIDVVLTTGQWILVFVLTIIFDLIVAICIICNNFTNKKSNKRYGYY